MNASTPIKRRRLKWILSGAAALALFLALLAVVAAVVIAREPVSAPLELPSTVASPVGPVDGTWHTGPKSLAGFRVTQTFLGLSSEVVGRTGEITGTVGIAGGQVTTARLQINLTTLTSNGKPAPQFSDSLETNRYPDAVVELAQPVSLDNGFTAGALTHTTATGRLTLHGVTRELSVPLSLRRDASTVFVVASIPIAFSDWNIAGPRGYGAIGSLSDHGVAELLVDLRPT